ncbi:hypothetical protein IQ259_01100 [Fortiea sp. LEGE XX443]|uniref:hypothetical protein n=1 Tax=Fortiea sp. LEGE XX443 TaxID=1828611 RepID=UPI00187EE38B|nr:hypothetical protein [Fortiea sp. LEGE XX443]MBE9003658.1 hypothetical protein [Fortiea sp. LEGE XX443]
MMSAKFITSNLFVELSTEEQQLVSGGQANRQPLPEEPMPLGGQASDGNGFLPYPTYICRPADDNVGGGNNGQ